MKKAWLLIILSIIVLVIFLLRGFPFKEKNSHESDKIVFVTPLAPVAYFAQRVGGEYVEAIALLPIDQDYHNFELSPSQVTKSYKADIFLTLGIAEEKPILEKMTDSHLKIYNIASQLDFIPYAEIGHSHEEEEEGHHHHHDNELDPHVWLSFSNMKNISLAICNIFKETMPEEYDYFQANLEELLVQLASLEKEVDEVFLPYAHHKLVVMHAGYGYFLEPFHIEQLSLESFQRESSLKQLLEVSNEKEGEHVLPFLFIQPQYNPEQAKNIANDLDLELILFNPIYKDPFKDISSLLIQVKEFAN